MPRPKKAESSPTVQMGIRLPRELRDHLEKAGGERGIAEEIRRRLELSFDIEGEPLPGHYYVPKAIKMMARSVIDMAANVSALGNWSKDRFYFDVFRAAINHILAERFEPEATEPHAVAMPAKELGEAIATIWLKQHPREEP